VDVPVVLAASVAEVLVPVLAVVSVDVEVDVVVASLLPPPQAASPSAIRTLARTVPRGTVFGRGWLGWNGAVFIGDGFLVVEKCGLPLGRFLKAAVQRRGKHARRGCIVKKQCGGNMGKSPQFLHNFEAQYRSMRIRLVHTQALMLLSAVLVAVLAMGALSAWNLRNGFTDYLASRDLERLEQFAALVSENAERAGSIEAMAAGGTRMLQLFQQFGSSQGGPPPPPHPPPHLPPPPGFSAPGKPPRIHIDSIDAFKDRVAIYGLDDRVLLGRPLTRGVAQTVEQPVVIHGAVVATVRMDKLKPVPDDVELRFLNTQYQSIVVVACLLLAIGLAGAFWISGHWVRPLIDIQAATERIARGEFDTRLDTSRSDELGDTMRNINRMAVGRKQLEGARRQWIADMSHELRTPLTVLRGEIDALIDGVIALTPQALDSLREEILQLNALVDDLHLLAMADLKALPCYFEELDATRFLGNLVERFSLPARQKGLALSFEEPSGGAVPVRWDMRRMEQLIGNLLDNSLRYTDAPGQVIVRLRTQGNDGVAIDRIAIEIEDSAPGVSGLDLSRIFEPLYRADVSRGRASGGSGLGLAICEQIARSHQGSISAVPSPLGGLRFTIDLPADGEAHA